MSAMTMLQPNRPKRSMLLRLINTVGHRFVKNGFSWMQLDEKTLLDKACAQTGLDDFGDDSFREALRSCSGPMKPRPNSASSDGSACTRTWCDC